MRSLGIVVLLFAMGVPATAQQSSSSSSSQSDSTLTTQPARPVETQQQPPAEQPSPETSTKKSKFKKAERKANDLIPYCVGIGSIGKCRHDADQEEQARRDAAEQDLRRKCRDAAEQSQPETPACADVRKSDAAHDVDVGDTYYGDKNYNAAQMRYRSALQTDPANASAMLHLAQTLEKLNRKQEAAEQYHNFLATDPPNPEAQKARAALAKLGGYRPAPPTP